jgi:hypothetical protein
MGQRNEAEVGHHTGDIAFGEGKNLGCIGGPLNVIWRSSAS